MAAAGVIRVTVIRKKVRATGCTDWCFNGSHRAFLDARHGKKRTDLKEYQSPWKKTGVCADDRGSEMSLKKAIVLLLVIVFTILWARGVFGADSAAEPEAKPDRQALILDLKGPIGPATRDFVTRSLELAAAQNAALVIIRMDTPGGLDASTRDIIKAILSSSVPVATYVTPVGSEGRERRRLHSLRQPHRRDESGHQCRRGHTGRDHRQPGEPGKGRTGLMGRRALIPAIRWKGNPSMTR